MEEKAFRSAGADVFFWFLLLQISCYAVAISALGNTKYNLKAAQLLFIRSADIA